MAPGDWTAVIGATATGITGIIVALSGLRRQRSAQLREELERCWNEGQATRDRLLAALSHIGSLEEAMTVARLSIPTRPPILGAGPTSAQPDAWQPRHAAR